MENARRASCDDWSMKQVYVCNGRSCQSFGAKRLFDKIQEYIGLKKDGEADTISVSYCQCLSFCERGPNVQVDRNLVFGASPETIIEEIQKGGVPRPDGIVHTIDIDEIII